MARLLKIYALLLLGLVLAELAARPAGAQLLRPRPLQPQSGNALASTSRPIDSIPSVSSEENTAESVSAVVGSSSRRLSADGKSGADAGSNSSGSAGSGIGAKANAQASVTATQQPSAPGAEVGAPSKGPGSAAGAVLAGGAGCSAPGPGAPPPCASPKPSPQPSPSPSPPRGPPFPNDNPDAILGPYDTLNVVTRPKKKPGLVERVAFGRGTVDQLDDYTFNIFVGQLGVAEADPFVTAAGAAVNTGIAASYTPDYDYERTFGGASAGPSGKGIAAVTGKLIGVTGAKGALRGQASTKAQYQFDRLQGNQWSAGVNTNAVLEGSLGSYLARSQRSPNIPLLQQPPIPQGIIAGRRLQQQPLVPQGLAAGRRLLEGRRPRRGRLER